MRLFPTTVLLFTLVASVAAQQTVTVSGTVRDASGGVIPGATVQVIVADAIVAVTTSGTDGRYQVAGPASVPFGLRAKHGGFADELIDFAGTTNSLTRDIRLQVSTVSDAVVVSATRSPESLTRVTQSVTVATSRDIDALGGASLADVVAFVPGVAVEGNGREGTPTSMFTRGGESDYNLVLIDGVRVNQNGGFFDFSRINASEIDRVEVVRGAQSSLWGSDAIGSVVQIFTRRAAATDEPRLTGSIEGGSFNTWRGDARIGGGAMGRFDYHAGVSHRRTDGAFADILPQDDDFEQTGVDGSIGTMLGARATLRAGLRYARGIGRSVGPVSFGARDTGGKYETRDVTWHADLSHTLGARYTGTGSISYFHYESRSEDLVGDAPYSTFAILEGTPNALFPDGIRLVRYIDAAEFSEFAAAGAMPAPNQYIASTQSFDFAPSRTKGELRRPGFRYQADVTWGNGQRLTGGWDWEHERRPEQTTPAVLPGLSVNNNGFFVQQQLTFTDRWVVTVGARADVKEMFDTFFSPKLSAGGFVLPARAGVVSSVKVFGNIGKGIKSPTFLERFGDTAFADPNPELKVERARTADIGMEATFANQRFRAGATYFNNHYKDQIAFRFGSTGDGIPEYINIDGSQADGWELEVALQRPVAGLTSVVTYALVDTEVVTNLSTSQQFQPGQPLLRRPKHSGTLRVAYARDRLTASVDTRWVGERHDNSFFFPPLRTVANASRPAFSTDITVNPGYAVAGAGVEYELERAATVFVRVNNIGGTEYDSALGYPGLPRNAMVGVRFIVSR